MFTMGEVADRSTYDEEFFYKTFGIDGEILIDHAWGIEPVTMYDIKHYHTSSHSLSNGQVLPRPYHYDEARLVFTEMADVLCCNMVRNHLVARGFTWWVSYDYKSMEACPGYDGPVCIDFYGRLHPVHSNGTVRLKNATNSVRTITAALLAQFDAKTDHRLLYRRLGISACDTRIDDATFQMDLFTDYHALDKEKRIQEAMLSVRSRYGSNAVVKGMNLMKGATTMERNNQIGGHRR